MAGRRGKSGQGSKGALGPESSSPIQSTPSGVSAADRADLASGNIAQPPAVLTIAEAVHAEHSHPVHREAELLETVSAAAIQMHPSAPAAPKRDQAADDLAQTAPAAAGAQEPASSQAKATAPNEAPHGNSEPVSPFWLPKAAAQVNLALWSHVQAEALAALAHLGALSGARSPADMIALQTREMERALGRTLDLGRDLAGASRKSAQP